MLGYAGDGGAVGTGLAPPKMALEFDTYVNSGRDDPDLGTSNRDVLQYVFWGDDQADLDDDNTHGTGGIGEKWSAFSTGSSEVNTKPLLNSGETALYVNANGNVYGINPDNGGSLFGPWNPFSITSKSSPALDASGSILMGENEAGIGFIDSIKTVGSYPDPRDRYNWYDQTSGVVDSSPVIDSSGIVYFGDTAGYFYAFNSSCGILTGCGYEWRHTTYPGSGADIKSTPALSPDESTVYFVSNQAQYLYALKTSDGTFKWRCNLNGNVNSSPTVVGDDDNWTIYVGSDGGSGSLYAVDKDGNEKWRYGLSGNPHSRPALGQDGTIYIGADDGKLYAITDDETIGILKWSYTTPGPDKIKGGPTVHDDGTIWFGADDGHLYIVDVNGLLLDRFDLIDQVQSSPTQGSDGTMYVGSKDNKLCAYKPTCNPQNIKTRVFSHDNLLAGDAVPDSDPVDGNPDVADTDDWLNSGPWAVRIEIERSETANTRGRYEYTLSTWIRQCQQGDCSDITATYFADTRIDYAAKDPHLEQTVELCSSEHTKFDTFLYGFTQATGSSTQTAVISNLNLGFIRPGDHVISNDANW